MSDIAIKFENISKQYRLGVIGTGTISHDLNRWWHTIRGKEDPYLQVGEVNDRSQKATSEYVWALKNISFEVKQGEVLGIIGKNGAGKSTLLKILSRVTAPTTGSIKAKGRIASLLEVGTGFHPEMTGRENIYMNGSIMGMTRAEINRKLDEIIDFAGVERYIDTPAKRYSSGMTVRLGFAIAAYLEPEILVVDEVLAVGDAEFQRKAIGKMQDVSKGEGRTVLFVSHNMGAIQSLCTECVILVNGGVNFTGSTSAAIDNYLRMNANKSNIELAQRTDRSGSQALKLINIEILNQEDKHVSEIISGNYAKFRLHFEKNSPLTYEKLFIGVSLCDEYENKIVAFLSDEMVSDFRFLYERDYIDLVIPNLYVRGSVYGISVQVCHGSTKSEDNVDVIENAMKVTVLEGDIFNVGKSNRGYFMSIFPGSFC